MRSVLHAYVTSIISPVQWWFVCGMTLCLAPSMQLSSLHSTGTAAPLSYLRTLCLPTPFSGIDPHRDYCWCLYLVTRRQMCVLPLKLKLLLPLLQRGLLTSVSTMSMPMLCHTEYNVMRFSPNTPCDGNGMHRSLSDAGRTFTTTLHHVHVLFSVSSHGSRNDDWYTRATTGARFSKQQHFSPQARPGQRPRRVLSRRVRPRLPGTRV